MSDVLKIGFGDLLAIDHFRGEIRVVPSVDFAAQAVHALPAAQKAISDLTTALCELHRAVTEHDGSDADDARLQDAIREAQSLAPYDPEEVDHDGF